MSVPLGLVFGEDFTKKRQWQWGKVGIYPAYRLVWSRNTRALMKPVMSSFLARNIDMSATKDLRRAVLKAFEFLWSLKDRFAKRYHVHMV